MHDTQRRPPIAAWILLISLPAFLPAALPTGAASTIYYYFPPPGETLAYQDQKLPAEVGLNPALVGQLAGKASRWALWRHGYLVHEHGDFNLEADVRSLRKTWHALTVGAAIQQGKIPDLDQKISAFENGLSGNDANATWQHVITQSAGFDYPGCGDSNDYDPGEMWTYSDLNLYHLNQALARAYGHADYYDDYAGVLEEAYFDAIGMQGWSTSTGADGVRLTLDLEDMGRLGLLMLARGTWNGTELIPQWFVEAQESKQAGGMLVNYMGCNDGELPFLNPADFPEAPYGYLTWVNTAGDYYPGADSGWAWGAGTGGYYILWNHEHGIVFAGVGVNYTPNSNGIPHIIEAHITGPNPLANSPPTNTPTATLTPTATATPTVTVTGPATSMPLHTPTPTPTPTREPTPQVFPPGANRIFLPVVEFGE